jgi:MFS family permease
VCAEGRQPKQISGFDSLSLSMKKLSTALGYRWVVLFVSLYAFVAFAFAFQLVPPLLSSVIHEFGVSHAQAGLLMSMVVIPGVFLAIPAGILVDRYGVRLTGSISTVLIAIGCFVTTIAVSFETALVGRLILGVGSAFITTAMPALISQWFPREELGKAMGIFGINMPLASVAAFSSASVLALTLGWRFPFYIGTAVAALNAIVFPILVREGPFRRERGPVSRQALRSVEAWKVGVTWLLFNGAALSFTTWSPKVFEDFRGMNPVQASLLASILMLAAIPCTPLFGSISDRIGRRRPLMVTGSTLMAGALVAVAYSPDATLRVLIVALGVVAAMVPPMVMALPPEILGPAQAGTGFGIITICLNTGIAVTSPLIGLLLDTTGSPTMSFLGMALFAAAGAAVAYTLKTK